MTTRLRQAAGIQDTAVLARVAENAAKLALVRAVAADPADPLIRAQDADWAIAFARYWGERTLAEIRAHIADNETEREHKRVLDIVTKATPGGGITKRQLTRDPQFLDKRPRNETIEARSPRPPVEPADARAWSTPALARKSSFIERRDFFQKAGETGNPWHISGLRPSGEFFLQTSRDASGGSSELPPL